MILFVASEGREFQGLLRHLKDGRRLAWPVQFAFGGELNGRPVALVADGPGPLLAGKAADVADDYMQPEAVVSVGFCGGLHPGLKRNTIVIASAVMDESGGVLGRTATPAARSRQWNPFTGNLLSIDRVAVTPGEKSGLRNSGADAVEMEAAGVLKRAHKWGKPFYGIRVVTDVADEGFSIDFNRMRDGDGRFSRSMIIKEACRNPFKLFPELLQFDRRCRRAAIALGDFIADCQF